MKKMINKMYSLYFYEILIFLMLFVTYSYFYQGAFSNQNTRVNLSLSLA